MDANLKAKWIEALRGGKYKQGKEQLRQSDDSFCCLGVLCDIIDPVQWREVSSGYRFRGREFAALSFPPPDVSERVGLPRHIQDAVAAMNDEGSSFAEIADYIEAHVSTAVVGGEKL